ncbi:hypothetical protein GY14_20880 [Delftia tsuruhatensis]|nr:hypothetical protein GY14_20880 [Delftia tsuruhatensis]
MLSRRHVRRIWPQSWREKPVHLLLDCCYGFVRNRGEQKPILVVLADLGNGGAECCALGRIFRHHLLNCQQHHPRSSGECGEGVQVLSLGGKIAFLCLKIFFFGLQIPGFGIQVFLMRFQRVENAANRLVHKIQFCARFR